MLLLFQDDSGEEVLATRMYRTYFCIDGHPMVVLLKSRRLKCVQAGCSCFNVLYVLPTETVDLVAA